jgi:hypothetical protein
MLQWCLKKVLPANTSSCAGFCSTHYLLLSLTLHIYLYLIGTASELATRRR